MRTKINSKGITMSVQSASLTVDCDFRRAAERHAEALMPEIARKMNETMSNIYHPARQRWPVRTGISKRKMKYERAHLTSSWTIKTKISNDARSLTDGYYYAYAIRPRWNQGKSIWQTFIVKPLKRNSRALNREFLEIMRRAGSALSRRAA